jgi:hypothetical protein
MIGTLATGVDSEAVRDVVAAWEKERHVAGYRSSHLMLGDDGRTVINVAIFDNKKAYEALADDPAQDAWWREKFQPLLADEPRWIDGTWLS